MCFLIVICVLSPEASCFSPVAVGIWSITSRVDFS